MRKFLRTKRGLLIAVCVLFTSVLGLSYATFIVNNGSYKATELLISKLNYGITIVEDGSTGSTIDNNSVTIPGGKTGYYVVTITSINSINTKYSLGYKTTSNATVQYTDRTAWEASGDIKGYDENTYSKKVRIVIDNSGNSSSATVSFAAFGGYTYRTIAEINLTDGYKTVTGPFTELAFSKTNKLIDVVEGDTSCTTSDTTNCLYGGGNLKNYVQFPEDEDKTKNIWRIVGSYDINGSYVTKLISETLISTTASTYNADLTTFYNTLTGIDAYIEETNYFNCYSTSCTANTNFTNIGLLTDYEFNEIGGVNTYLNRKMPFIVNSEEGLKEVTTSGYNETVSASTNARAVIYLKNKTHVINSGTEADPYILSPETDVAIIGYTVNGKATSDKFEDLLKTNLVNQITCDKGTTAVWDNETSSIKLSNIKAPDYCTIDFKDGFTVTLTAGSTGTVSAPVSQMVGYNGIVTFTVTSTNGSTTLSKNTCGGTLSGNTYTLTNVKENKACEIEFGAVAQKLYDKLLQDNPTISTRSAFSSPFTTNTVNTLYKATENGTDVYYFAGIDGTPAHCEVEGITGELYKFIDGYNTDLEGLEVVDEETCTTKSLCNLSEIEEVYFDLTQAQCQELAENQLGYFDESMYSEDLTNRTWYTEVIKPINNWVKFGKNSSNQDLYWRIIRTNADGSIRLLYHGTSTATDAYIGTSKFNEKSNDSMYVGYMYGTSGSQESNRTNTNNSTIKTAIDNWYASNMTSYTKYLSTTAVYCNDREVGSGTYSATGSNFYYAAYTRLETNKTPTYDCTNDNDKFTVDASTGNGKLTYPIALMTADEIAYAGGVSGTDAPMWYYTNSTLESSTSEKYWWSLSPYYWDGDFAHKACSWLVNGSVSPGSSIKGNVDDSYGVVRPAVSLKSCIKYSTGNGTSETPYEIVETSSGC